MAISGKATRSDFVEENVFTVGRDFAKSLDPAIASTIEWKEALQELKEAALAYSKLEGDFKVSDSRKEFLKIKQEEEKLRQQAQRSIKAEQDALIAIERLKKAELDTAKKKLSLDAQKERAQKRAIKLTEQEKLERRLLARGQREAAVISSKLSTEYEKQSTILTQLRRKYKDVALRQGESSREARQLQREITKLDATLKKVDANVGQFQRNVGNYPKALNAARKAALSFASAIGFTGATFLAVQTVRDAINTVREFDRQVIAVQKTTNFTDEEIKQFSRDVVKLGIELEGISTQGLLESAEVAGQLGIQGSENVLKFAETIQKLSLTSDIAGEESAQNFAKFIEVSQDTVENADRLGSVITELGNNFATTESQILKNTVEIQKGISIYNASAQSVLGLGAATNALGNEAEAARGALQTAFRILNDGATTGRNLERILRLTGQTVEEFKKEFANDAVRTFQRFIKGLADSEKEGKNLSATLEALGITEKRATTVVGSLAKNYETLEDALSRANEEYELNNALNKEAQNSAESLDSKIRDLEDAFENLTIGVDQGTGAISTFFKSAVEGLTDFINGLGEVNKTAAEKGVEAARGIVDDFKNGTEIVEGETKGFILRTIQQADENIGTLQDRINELKDSFLITEDENGRLRYFGVDFGKSTLDRIRELQEDLEKEKATRDELNQILLEEGRAKEKLVQETAKLAAESAAQQGREINLSNQIVYFRTLSVERLKELNAQYSNVTKTIGKVEESEEDLEKRRKKAAEEAEKRAKLNRDNANALSNFRLEQQIREQEKIVKNEEESFANREAALAERTRKEVELAEQLAQQKIEEAEGQADAITLIEEQLQARLKEIREGEEDVLDGFEVEKIRRQSEIAKAELEKRLEDELRLEREAFARREIPQENFEQEVEAHEKRIAEIKRRYALEALNAQVSAIETLLRNEELSAEKRAEFELELARIKNEIAGLGVDSFITNNESRVDNEKETAQEILQISSELTNALNGLADAIFANRIQKIDEEIRANDERFERLLENENLTAQERERIEQQQERQREELEKKKRKEQRRQAVFNKTLALADVAIQTALAIIKSVAASPLTGGQPFATIAAIIGGIQAAAIIAQPIPAYFKGTDNHPGGLALVGEERPEVIQEPNRRPYIVDRPTILDLPKRTVVTPSVEEYEKMFRATTLASVEANEKRYSGHEARKIFEANYNMDGSRLEKKLENIDTSIKSLAKRPVVFNGKINVEPPYTRYN